MKILCITPVHNIKGAKENLESIGEVIYNPDITKEELIIDLSINKYDILFTNPNRQNYKLDIDVLGKSDLKIICTASTGTNHIDMNYCKKNNIHVVSNTVEYDMLEKVTSTAEMAFTLMMMALRKSIPANESVLMGDWDCEHYIGRQLNKLKVGIVGYGRLGKMMAKYCKAFDAEVIVYDPYKVTDEYPMVDNLKTVFEECDVVSLHVHVNEETTYMINTDILRNAKKNLVLVNTSRGEIVKEDDLVESLLFFNDIGHYATDVFEHEFGNFADSLVWVNRDKTDKITIVPHIGGMTHDAREIAYNHVINKLKKHIING